MTLGNTKVVHSALFKTFSKHKNPRIFVIQGQGSRVKGKGAPLVKGQGQGCTLGQGSRVKGAHERMSACRDWSDIIVNTRTSALHN